jgi:SAM-dependent methyltransferase
VSEPSPGDVTLQTYQAAAESYRAQTRQPGPALVAFLDLIAATAGAGARVLELGSGPGTDAVALEHRGLRVDRTDATPAFVDMLRADGYSARQLDVRTDPLGGPYDVVLADAVLLHLTRVEFAAALRSARAAITDRGLLAITLKDGDGEEWHSRKVGLPRFFTYWREPALHTELGAAGWRVEHLEHVRGAVEDWHYIVCRAA